MTRDQLTDSDREILESLEADARPSAEDMEELLESADCVEDVFGELIDSSNYYPDGRETVGDPGERCDDGESYPY